MEEEITRRTGMAKGKVKDLQRVWKSKKLKMEHKVRFLEALSFSVALYNADVWTINEMGMKKLIKFQRDALKTMTQHKRIRKIAEEKYDKISRKTLLKQTNMMPVEDMVLKKRLTTQAVTKCEQKRGGIKETAEKKKISTKWIQKNSEIPDKKEAKRRFQKMMKNKIPKPCDVCHTSSVDQGNRNQNTNGLQVDATGEAL